MVKSISLAKTFVLAVFFPITLSRIYNDEDVAAIVPEDIKNRIDELVEAKLKLYLSTYFEDEELDVLEGHNTDQGVMNKNTEAILSRSKRSLVENVNSTDNGGYSSWTNFGPCSASCGKGKRQRSRTCTAPSPQNNGENCTRLGPAVETRYCTVAPCIAETFVLKDFNYITSMWLPFTMEIKQFKIGDDDYIGVLSQKNLQLYKWDEKNRLFAKHKQAITVHGARSFDSFRHIIDHYIILAETVTHSYGTDSFTRILSFNDVTKTFDFRKQIMLTLPYANKVVAFEVFGQPHAAFIQYESKAPGHKITTTICGQQSKTIKCLSGSSITVRSAFYGRKSWSICNHGWFFNIRPCSAPLILEKVAMMCNNRTQCTLKAPPNGISDPCPVFTKYLTVVYTCDKKMHKNVPRFYVWKSVSFQVIPSDSLVTYGATDIEAFALHHKHFIVVANYINDQGSHHLDSEIFIYSSNLKRFISFQRLRTDAALDWEFFSIGEGLATEYFLAVANHFKLDKTGRKQYSVDSVIYKWNWNLFVPFQCIKAHAARKWAAVKGSRGEFLLTLSTGESHNITTYAYNGWRFHPTEIKLQSSHIHHGVSTAYSLRVKNETMLLVDNVDNSNYTKGDAGHLFNVTFRNAYPRYKLLNSTLFKIDEINRTLGKLTNSVDKINETFYKKRDKMVFLSDNKTISGLKTFTNVEVHGDLKSINSALKVVQLSSVDTNIIKRQHELQTKLLKQDSDLILLDKLSMQTLSKSKDQIIDVPFNFESSIDIGSLQAPILNVSGTVNGKDISEVAAEALYIDKNHTIFGFKTFAADLNVRGDLEVLGKVDGINTSNIVTLHTDQVISGKKTFVGNMDFRSNNGSVENIEVKGRLDGVLVSKSELMTLTGNQTISGVYEFLEDVHVQKDIVAKTVNNVDLTKLYDDAVLVDTAQNISGYKAFAHPVKIIGDLQMSAGTTVDQVDVSELQNNVLSRTKDQNISSSVYFGNDVVFKEPLKVAGYINGINVSTDLVFLSTEQEVIGEKHFMKNLKLLQNIDVLGLVNNVNISGDLMTINGNQTITGKKTFSNNLTVRADVAMNDGKMADSVDLSELAEEAVYLHTSQVITGNITFSTILATNITVKCNESCHLVELLKNLTEKTVKKNKPSVVAGLKTFSKDVLVSGNMIVGGYINGVKVPNDLALKNKSQVVRGKKTFKYPVHIDGDVRVKGNVNSINISELYEKGLRLNGSQIITGKKTFLDGLSAKGNMYLNGTINKIDILNDLVKLTADENITAHKIFKESVWIGNLSVDKMQVEGLIDNTNITDLNRSVLKKTGNQTISGNVTFEQGFSIAGNLISGGINGINLTDLDLNALKTGGNQTVTGKKVFTQPVTVRTLLHVDGLVDGINISKLSVQRVTLDGNQSISGRINFTSNVNVVENIHIDQLINGINITKLKEDALYLSGNQSITGIYHFNNINIRGDVEMNGKINGIDLSKEAVTLTGNELINEKTFTNKVILLQNLLIGGLIDGVNITKLKQEAVLLFGVQIVEAKKTFRGDLTLYENLNVDGLVDGVNVTELNLTALSKNKDQVISGSYVFLDDVNFTHPAGLAGLINEINVTEFNRNLVTKSTPQVIAGAKIFNKVTVYGDVSAKNLNINGTINGVDISKLNRNAVRVDGKHYIRGMKIFTKEAKFDNGISVNGTINGLRLPQDVVLLSANQTIKGIKTFEQDLIIQGDLNAEPGINIDNVDVSALAANAVYLNGTQTIYGPVEFTNVTAYSDIFTNGLINGVNVTRENLLLRTGKQEVTGKKTFSDIFVKGNLTVGGNIDGVDVMALNRTSMFANRNNIVTASKEIFGNLIVKGNLSADKIDGIRVSSLKKQLDKAENTVRTEVSKLTDNMNKQKSALNQYIESIQTLRPKLDFFIVDQTIKFPSTTVSFDAITFNNSVLMILLDNRNDVNSSIYKRDTATGKFIPYGKIPTHHGSDVKMFVQGPIIHAAISSKPLIAQASEQSTVYSIDFSTGINTIAKHKRPTKYATQVDIVKFNNKTLITFTSTFDLSTNKVCVSNTPFLINLANNVNSTASILGCNVNKVLTRQIDSNNFLLVSLNSGLYSGREAIIYKVNINGTYSVLQRLPTFYAADALFLKIKSDLFLVIANEYQKSDWSFLTEYNVPVQIYKFNQSSTHFIWYQDLKAPGANLVNSFNVHGYTYLAVASKIHAVKIFQFMGAGKFSQVDSVLSKGPNHIKRVRSWNINDETFVALLSTVSSPFPQNQLSVFKAVKTANSSAADINKQLQKANFSRPL